MKTGALVLLACVILHSGCGVKGVPQKQPVDESVMQDKKQTVSEVDKEAAIKVAKENAAKNYGPLEDYNVVSCEQKDFWRIFFEPNSTNLNRKGVVYVISKPIGWIVSHRELALTVARDNKENRPSKSGHINQGNAVAIAEKDGIKAYGSLVSYDLTVCELTTAWIVIFSPKEGSNGGGPEYVIDKETGEIIDKKYYQ